MNDTQNSVLAVDGVWGRYSPQEFMETYYEYMTGLPDDAWEILVEGGPNHEYYWDVWNDVEMQSSVHYNGTTYQIDANIEGIFLTEPSL